MGEQRVFDFADAARSAAEASQGPVECLGEVFANDELRRAHYLRLLSEKLKDPEFRAKPGFPVGSDSDILALSDPPYYTACPNPFLCDFAVNQTDETGAQNTTPPFASDISIGKGDRSYYIHTYHTKVPPSAVAELVRHYTSKGDIVLDCFAGSGMTAVGSAIAKEKALTVVLSDLSPSATFISYFHSFFRPSPLQASQVEGAFKRVRQELGHYFTTTHTGWPASATAPENRMNPKESSQNVCPVAFVVWSEHIRCPDCTFEETLWSAIVDLAGNSASVDFRCKGCDAKLTRQIKGAKRRNATVAETVTETFYEPVLEHSSTRVRRSPVLISYDYNGKRFEKYPDAADLELISKASQAAIKNWFPIEKIPDGDKTGDPKRAGISYVHQYYSPRSLAVLALLREELSTKGPGMLGFLTAILTRCSWQNRYMPQHRGNRSREVVGPLSGTLYIPPFALEINPIEYGETKSKQILKRLKPLRKACVAISTESASQIGRELRNQVDYAFIDPPFGENLQYSELSFVQEAWLKVRTNWAEEMVVNQTQKKDVHRYGQLIRSALESVYAGLKPGKWVTIEFSNSSNVIWNVIQNAAGEAGLVVADVRVLDKNKGTTKQLTQINTVKCDLLISAYKPLTQYGNEFHGLGTHDKPGVWTFVEEHLARLPLFNGDESGCEVVFERQGHRLFDRLLSFLVQRNLEISISASEFLEQLKIRFPERDGMYFLPEQVSYYDRKRVTSGELRQLSLFVNDERSAIQWVRQQLQDKPQSFQDLQPFFMQQLQSWSSHEKSIELKEILHQNFFIYDGAGPVPSQIHSYLSTNFKELRNLEKDDARLKAKAKERWYVPNPNRESDLEKLRLRTLLKEFEHYRSETKRKIRQFRTEAVRAGFKFYYDQLDYRTIIDVAAKLPEKVIQEDDKLLMYYDVASTRLGD